MTRTHTERLWIGGGAVAAVLVAGATWAFAVSPKLSHVDALHSQAQDTQLQNLSLQGDVGRLQAAYARIDALRGARASARTALPADNSLSALTQQLGRQARAAKVSVNLVNVGNPTPVAAASPTTAAPAPAGSTAPAPAAAAPAATSTGLYSIPVTVMVTGSANNDVRFLDAVQHKGPRAVLVGSTQFAAATNTGAGGAGAGGVAMTVTMQAFVAPQGPVASATTAPVAAPPAQ